MTETFAPVSFVGVHGSNFDVSKLKGTTLVLPLTSAGMNATIAADLYILNEGATKVGFLYSEYISPVVFNDSLSPQANGSLTMPCEIYLS